MLKPTENALIYVITVVIQVLIISGMNGGVFGSSFTSILIIQGFAWVLIALGEIREELRGRK